MADPGHSEMVSPAEKRAITEAWLRLTARAYPSQTAELLLADEDRFLNPAGYVLRRGLPMLVDAALGGTELEDAAPVIEELLRIRAVQDFSATEAVSFISLLKPLVRERLGTDGRIEDRIDRLARMACDAYVRCRQALLAIQAVERRRRAFVAERMLHS